MKKLIFLIMVSLAYLFLASCSGDDNPTNSNSGKQLLPMKQGTYWIYQNYVLDSATGERTNAAPTIDSTAVTGATTKLNENCSIFTDYPFQNGSYSQEGTENYFRNEDQKVYTFSTYIKNMLLSLSFLQNLIEDKWIKIADPDDDLWRTYEQNIDSLEYVIGPYTIMIRNISITVLGSYKGKRDITIGGNACNTHEFLHEMTFLGTVDLGQYTQQINIKRNLHLYFAKDLGLVRSVADPFAIDIVVVKAKINGSESELLRYNIVK